MTAEGSPASARRGPASGPGDGIAEHSGGGAERSGGGDERGGGTAERSGGSPNLVPVAPGRAGGCAAISVRRYDGRNSPRATV